jgi:hypothetical protein
LISWAMPEAIWPMAASLGQDRPHLFLSSR